MNYYNDNDPKICAWLRQLIAEGYLPMGIVDQHSIADIEPAKLHEYTQCHFFAGIGGWSLALKLAGWPANEPVWTGSCPCQPLSCAGQRKGHADERHLWPAFYRLIAECAPPIVFGEQVASPDGLEWFAGIRADLEAAGYAVGGADLCAAGVGALHRRQRLWWVANASGVRPQRLRTAPKESWSWQQFEGLVQAEARLAVPSGKDRALVDGIPNRILALKGLGNAIVPQVAAAFIQASVEAMTEQWTAELWR